MPKKVLLIDNNHEYRHALASIVRRIGYDVIHADKTADAVERLVSDRPDLLMVGDGAEMSNQFPVKIPVVVYTAQRTSSWVRETLSNGAAEILTKPIVFGDLSKLLHKHLQTPRKRPRPIPSPCVLDNDSHCRSK